MTANYKIIIPVMFACILGSLTAKKLYHDSIDTVELTRKGINMHDGLEATILSTIQVGSVMKKEFTTIHEDTDIHDLLDKIVDIAGYGLGIDNETLGVVRLNNININLEMVRQGMVKTFCGRPPAGLDLEPYLEAEREARQSKRGIWKNSRGHPDTVTGIKKERAAHVLFMFGLLMSVDR